MCSYEIKLQCFSCQSIPCSSCCC